MSDLKHKTAQELSEIISSSVSYRAKLESEWIRCEAEAQKLQERANVMRKKWHDAGQRECWARIYLAEKA